MIAAEIPASKEQPLPKATITKSVAPIREIRSLIDAQKLVQLVIPTTQTKVVAVKGVKVNSTDRGLEVILETGVKSNGLQVTPKTEGNSYIADIPNAQLRLSNGKSFRQSKPVNGITEVSVTNVDANTMRLTVTGEASVPAVELFDNDEGLVFRVSAATTTQQPTPDEKQPPSDNSWHMVNLVTSEAVECRLAAQVAFFRISE